jgi:hypothetical protein
MTERANVVKYGDREFQLEEPSADHVIGILNAIGAAAVRAESAASRLVKNPGGRAVLFGLLAVLSTQDLMRLGSVVLQFPVDSKGKKEAKQFFDEQGIKVAPLVEALMINFRLSRDLVEAIRAFFGGIDEMGEMFGEIEMPEALAQQMSQAQADSQD